MCTEHVVDVGLVVAPVCDFSSAEGSAVFISTKEEYFASRFADSKVWSKVDEIVAEVCEALLHFVGEVVVAAISFDFVPDEHDTEFCRVIGDVVAQLSHYAVEGVAGLQYAVMDVELVVGSQVKEPDAQR